MTFGRVEFLLLRLLLAHMDNVAGSQRVIMSRILEYSDCSGPWEYEHSSELFQILKTQRIKDTSDATPSSPATHGSNRSLKTPPKSASILRTFELHSAFDVRGTKPDSKRDVTDNIKEPRIQNEPHPSAYPTDFRKPSMHYTPTGTCPSPLPLAL